MNNIKSNTEGLKAYARHKKESTAKKVDEAVKRLIKTKSRINFNSVSIESGVSKAYLYKNLEIRNRIEILRNQQEGLSSPAQVKREMTSASKDVLIVSKNKRIKELENEIKKLREELKYLRGKIYDIS